MKAKIISLMGVALLMLAAAFASIPSMALTADDFNFSGTDSSGDVANPNVDLVSASTSVVGTDVVLTLTVAGNIVQNDENYSYGFLVMDSSGNNAVTVQYSMGSAMYSSASEFSTATVDVSGATLNVHIPLAVFSTFSGVSMVTANTEYYDGDVSMDDMIMMMGSSSGDDGWDDGGSGDDGTGDGGSGGFSDFPTPVITDTDPATETPTDTSISVSVTYVNVVMKNKTDEIEMDMTVRGTTSGADHVAIGWSTYYKNGTHEWEGSWMVGPFEVQSGDLPFGMGHIYEYYFKNTSADWKTWEFRMHMTFPQSDAGDFNDENGTDFEDVDHMRVYARAYSDSEGNNWNQAYYDLTLSVSSDGNTISGSSDSTSDDGGFGIPGFEAIAIIGALSVVAVAYGIRRRH